MTSPIPLTAWERPYWQPNDEEIVLQFYVFGEFEAVRVPSQPYGSPGLPAGITSTNHYHHALRSWDGYPLKGSLGKLFKEESPEAYQRAVDAPQVLVVRGTIKDAADTGYLRDVMGVLAGLLDIGGVAILDPQILTLLDADGWRRRYLVREGAPIRSHLLILRDGDSEPGRNWIHTRGMRKFGRPDFSLRGVPDDQVNLAGSLCERLVELEALGGRFQDGQQVEIPGLPDDLTGRLGGSLEHPDFHNTFVEFRWPA